MKPFMETTIAERRAAMHSIIDRSYCSLIVYYGDDNCIRTYAAADNGNEYDILELFAAAASRAAVMVENHIDPAADTPC